MASERLPSFVELMASLGLQNADDAPSPLPPPSSSSGAGALPRRLHFPGPAHSHSSSLSSTTSSLASPRGALFKLDSAPVTPASPDPMYQQQQQHLLQHHQHSAHHLPKHPHPHPPSHGSGPSYPPGTFHTQQMSKLHRSPSIIISESDSDQESSTGSEHSRRSSGGRNRLARYTPYQSQTLHTRRVSMPSLIHSDDPSDIPPRALSSSPDSTEQPARRPRKLHLSTSHHDVRAGAYTAPISSYVRRRTPTASPTSATFPHHHPRRKTSPTDSASRGPLSIPTLPTLFPNQAPRSRRSRSPPFKNFSFPRAESPKADMDVLPNRNPPFPSSPLPRQHAGLRISTYRSDRNDSLRPSDAIMADS